MPTPNANTIWADGPVGSPYEPEKSLIRQWGTEIENNLAAGGWPQITDSAFGSAATAASRPTNSSAINAALADCATKRIFQLFVPAGTFKCNDDIVNTLGVRFIGPGYIILPSGEKLNSYRQNPRDINGWEHAFYWDTSCYLGTPLLLKIHGNSIAAGDGVVNAKNKPAALLTRLAFASGVRQIKIDNLAVSGTAIDDFDPSSWIGDGNVNACVLFYTTNDMAEFPAGDSLELFVAGLEAKFAALRAARGYQSFSIFYVGPITGSDSFSPSGATHGRDEQAYEKCLFLLREVCHRYCVTFIDAYTPFPDSRSADAQYRMDSLGAADPVNYLTTARVHPFDQMSGWIWVDCLGKRLFARSNQLNGYNTVASIYSGDVNAGSSPLATSNPQDFPFGWYSYRSISANGWKDGALIIHRTADGLCMQINWDFLTNTGQIRFGLTTTWGPWSQWGNTGNTGFTLGTGVTSDAGSPAQVVKSGGLLMIKGGFNKSANIAAADIIATSAAGFRPDLQVGVMISSGAGNIAGVWKTNGQIVASAPLTLSGATYISIIGSAVAA